MHGIVNRGLQLFLIEEYGEDFWRELAVSLDQESGFEALLLYDDEVTRGLMSAAARRLNCTRKSATSLPNASSIFTSSALFGKTD